MIMQIPFGNRPRTRTVDRRKDFKNKNRNNQQRNLTEGREQDLNLVFISSIPLRLSLLFTNGNNFRDNNQIEEPGQ
jgi:hypothetical protein